MFAILRALGRFVTDLFKSRCRLEAENLLLRHQLTIASRRAPLRPRLFGSDRALLVWITRLWPSLLGAVQVVQLEGSVTLTTIDRATSHQAFRSGDESHSTPCVRRITAELT